MLSTSCTLTLDDAAAKIVAKWTHGKLTAAWNGLMEAAHRNRRFHMLMAKVAKRIQNHQMVAPFMTWKANVETMSRHRRAGMLAGPDGSCGLYLAIDQ